MTPWISGKAAKLVTLKALDTFFEQQEDDPSYAMKQSRQKRAESFCVPIFPEYVAYEKAKHCWDAENPEASATERNAAIIRIADECEV